MFRILGSDITYTHAHLTQFALIYMFNLILGAGPLALPKAFSLAGLVLGTLLLIFLAFMSFMTTTYMIEAMASANAYVRYHLKQKSAQVHISHSPSLQKDLEVNADQIYWVTRKEAPLYTVNWSIPA